MRLNHWKFCKMKKKEMNEKIMKQNYAITYITEKNWNFNLKVIKIINLIIYF